MKEVKNSIMFVGILFMDEIIIMVERLDVHLFIWKQEGWCVDLLEKSHSVVNVTISICSAHAERVSLFLMYRMCSRNLDFKLRLVCPT